VEKFPPSCIMSHSVAIDCAQRVESRRKQKNRNILKTCFVIDECIENPKPLVEVTLKASFILASQSGTRVTELIGIRLPFLLCIGNRF
jgi:hypothetical protein